MERGLQVTVDNVLGILGATSMDPNNVLGVTIEHTESMNRHTFICSVHEPIDYDTLPINAIWIVLDVESPYHRRALKLISKQDPAVYQGTDAIIDQEFKYCWYEAFYFDDVFASYEYLQPIASTVRGPRGQRGPIGDDGDIGAKGDKGDSGTPGTQILPVQTIKAKLRSILTRQLSIDGPTDIVIGTGPFKYHLFVTADGQTTEIKGWQIKVKDSPIPVIINAKNKLHVDMHLLPNTFMSGIITLECTVPQLYPGMPPLYCTFDINVSLQ